MSIVTEYAALSLFIVARLLHERVPLSVMCVILLHFSLTVKAATLIFISGCASAISYAKEGKSGFIYNLVKSK